MFTWTSIFAVILVLFAAFCIYRGHIPISDQYNRSTSWITRSEKPVQFWLIIVFILALAAVLGFNIFNL
ncbi:MAG: hypothetical protein A2Y54_09645 [Chloroflexi bacterium RBG_16_51_16]|nr:MAG: hypothetical protein A2Y54_09645 [Chloroflexi bacterium RBG_16_51_16]